MHYNLLIKNGFIVDGSGKPGFYGDLAVADGEIIEIAQRLEIEAERVIDAVGLTVCPGFIDPHVHAELAVLESGKFEEYLRQGVTTTINGNCGHSITPYASDNIYEYMAQKGLISREMKSRNKRLVPAWTNFSSYIETIKTKGTNLNMGFLLGHGTLRWSVMGGSINRQPTVEEETRIAHLMEEGLEQGAMGLSTGLTYSPSKYADTEELIKLSKVAEKYDGIYASHTRSYRGILEAVKEAIRIGETTGIRVQVSHLTPNSPEAFDEILIARDRGVEIAVDTIPKSSGHFKRKDRILQFIVSSSSQLFDLDANGSLEAFKTPEGRRRIIKKIRFKEQLVVINTLDPQMENRTLKEIAFKKGVEVDELILHLLENDGDKLTFCQGGLTRPDYPGMPYADNIANNPLAMVGSDIVYGETDDPYAWYEVFRKGSFPLFLDLCRKKGVSLEEIIRRMTSLPAQHFRLSNRGLLARGKAADITIIDMEKYNFPSNEKIDYTSPFTMAEGVKYTIVNGKVALDDGAIIETMSGQLISTYGKTL